MPIINTFVRRYSPPTCTLEVKGRESPLSQWVDLKVLNDLKFKLSFDDPRQPEDRRVTIWGDRTDLEDLCQAVDVYVQKYIDDSRNELPSLLSSSAAPASLPPVSPQNGNGNDNNDDGSHPLFGSESGFYPGIPDNDYPLEALELENLPPEDPESFNTGFPGLNLRPASPYLQRRDLLSHDLFLGPLETEESGPAIPLSILQLFDLANALDDYAAEFVTLPRSDRRFKIVAPPTWTYATAAVLLVAVGLVPVAIKLLNRPKDSATTAVLAPTPQPLSTQPTPLAAQTLPTGTPTNLPPATTLPGSSLPGGATLPRGTTGVPSLPPSSSLGPALPNSTSLAPPTQFPSNSRSSIPLPSQPGAQSSFPPLGSGNLPNSGYSGSSSSPLVITPSDRIVSPPMLPPGPSQTAPQLPRRVATPSRNIPAPRVSVAAAPRQQSISVAPPRTPTTSRSPRRAVTPSPIRSSPARTSSSTARSSQPPSLSALPSVNPNLTLPPSLEEFTASPPTLPSESFPSTSASSPFNSSFPEVNTPSPSLQPSAAPITQNNTADNNVAANNRLFDTIPQVAEVRNKLQQGWTPPTDLTQSLQYSMMLSGDGTIERIIPLTEAAKKYMDRTGIPIVGEPFVSPIDGGGNPQMRVVFNTDGKVETFLEP